MNKIKLIIITTIAIIISIMMIYKIFDMVKNSKEEFIYSNIIYENILDTNSTDNTNIDAEIKEDSNEKIKIHIVGEVLNQGIIEIEEGERISDAIEKAGGVTKDADLSKINLAYILQDGQKLYIPSINDSKEIEYISEENGEGIIENTDGSNKLNSIKKVNLNKASETDLEKIPGVGPSLAHKIYMYRVENGKFKSIEDLKNVSGIGDKKFESMREYIEVK